MWLLSCCRLSLCCAVQTEEMRVDIETRSSCADGQVRVRDEGVRVRGVWVSGEGTHVCGGACSVLGWVRVR